MHQLDADPLGSVRRTRHYYNSVHLAAVQELCQMAQAHQLLIDPSSTHCTFATLSPAEHH